MAGKEDSVAVGTEVVMALVLRIQYPFQVEEVEEVLQQVVVLVQREQVVA
jgi:hypothetical protein